MIEQDRKMKDFMKKEREKLSAQEHRGEMTVEQEQSLKKKVLRGNWGIAKDKASIHASMEKVQSYEEAFAKIQAATGISDIDELVQNFVNAEDQNFSLFNYANELSGDIEKLEAQISELKEELEHLRGVGSGQADAQKQKVLSDLEERWNTMDKKAEQYELKYQQAVKTLTAVRAGIQSIFNRLGCNAPDAVGGIGGSQGVTEGNVVQYLGVIEGRTNEILLLYQTLQEQNEEDDEAAPAPQRAPASSQLQIKLPSTVEDYSEDEEDDDEDDQRPFTREELKLKSMRGIQKKQDKSQKRRGGK